MNNKFCRRQKDNTLKWPDVSDVSEVHLIQIHTSLSPPHIRLENDRVTSVKLQEKNCIEHETSVFFSIPMRLLPFIRQVMSPCVVIVKLNLNRCTDLKI